MRVALLCSGGQSVVGGMPPERVFGDRAVPGVDGPLKNGTDVGARVARGRRVQVRLVEWPARPDRNVVRIIREVLVPAVVEVVAQIGRASCRERV